MMLEKLSVLLLAIISIQTFSADEQFDHQHGYIIIPPHYSYLAGTDTDLILQCMHNNNSAPYIEYVKQQILQRIDALIDELVSYSYGQFLDSSVVVGGLNQPYDHTRDAFKASLNSALLSSNPDILPPSNAEIKSLFRFESQVIDSFFQDLDQFIDGLVPCNGQFLDCSVMVGGLNQPHDQTKDAFKAALMQAVFN